MSDASPTAVPQASVLGRDAIGPAHKKCCGLEKTGPRKTKVLCSRRIYIALSGIAAFPGGCFDDDHIDKNSSGRPGAFLLTIYTGDSNLMCQRLPGFDITQFGYTDK